MRVESNIRESGPGLRGESVRPGDFLSRSGEVSSTVPLLFVTTTRFSRTGGAGSTSSFLTILAARGGTVSECFLTAVTINGLACSCATGADEGVRLVLLH